MTTPVRMFVATKAFIVKDGKITITKYGENLLEDKNSQLSSEEKLLRELSKNKKANLSEDQKSFFDILVKRGLAKLNERTIRTYSATDLAKRVLRGWMKVYVIR